MPFLELFCTTPATATDWLFNASGLDRMAAPVSKHYLAGLQQKGMLWCWVNLCHLSQ
jgi:hypothetical protein